ncbi:MAG: transglycosylase SLT domain-containing protein [Burkholderiales bacterium]
MTRRAVHVVVLALAALAGAPALAIDSALHDLPDDAFAPPAAAQPEAGVTGVEVRGVRDLGARGAAPAPGPADLWERIRAGFAIPDLTGKLVVQRQAWYAQRPEQLRLIVERSRRYLFHIVEALERRGMPTELALLPMVESAFNPMAYSRAHASGLWQFIPSTGRNYNLEQNWWYDARRDIMASTVAALDYLQSLHEQFGDWHLALAAYNMGENGLARAIERNRARRRPTDYASLALPKETRAYVPSLQAFKNIVADPAAATTSPSIRTPPVRLVTLAHDVDFKVAARLAEMPVEELVALNLPKPPGRRRRGRAGARAPGRPRGVFLMNLEPREPARPGRCTRSRPATASVQARRRARRARRAAARRKRTAREGEPGGRAAVARARERRRGHPDRRAAADLPRRRPPAASVGPVPGEEGRHRRRSRGRSAQLADVRAANGRATSSPSARASASRSAARRRAEPQRGADPSKRPAAKPATGAPPAPAPPRRPRGGRLLP